MRGHVWQEWHDRQDADWAAEQRSERMARFAPLGDSDPACEALREAREKLNQSTTITGECDED